MRPLSDWVATAYLVSLPGMPRAVMSSLVMVTVDSVPGDCAPFLSMSCKPSWELAPFVMEWAWTLFVQFLTLSHNASNPGLSRYAIYPPYSANTALNFQ